MSKFYKKLQFDFDIIKDISQITGVSALSKFNPDEIITQDFINLVDSIGLTIANSIVLYYPQQSLKSGIHIDDVGIVDQVNLNYVIDYGSALTNWYSPIGDYNGDTSSNIFTKILRYDINKMSIVESYHITECCLFQGGVPHNVSNIKEPRWCVSIKLRHKNGNIVTWDNAVNLFKEFIIDTV
jgi:hypothetical protein